jgi:hypothetical protein
VALEGWVSHRPCRGGRIRWSCFVPFYGGGLFSSNTVSLWRQGTPGGDSVAYVIAQLLFLFGGVATVAVLAIAGLTRRDTSSHRPCSPRRSRHGR